jgi:hypothetical protein
MGRNWLAAIDAVRRTSLPDRRAMCYKRLDDPYRQNALVPFLQAAADLDGHLIAVAVDKRKKWLSTHPHALERFREDLRLTAKWNKKSFEALMRKVHFNAILLSIWAQPYTNVTWITDQDEFVANDARHDDALALAGRISSLYIPHPMGVFRLNTTGQDPEQTEYEDLCAIPDLAAGMLSDVATRLSLGGSWEQGLRRILKSPLPLKAQAIADWFWDDQMMLRKTLISIDVEGAKYGVRKVWME